MARQSVGEALEPITDAELPIRAEVVGKANTGDKVMRLVVHGAPARVSANKEDGTLLKGRRATGVPERRIRRHGIQVTPLRPEMEMRRVVALFEAKTAFVDMAATHVVVDGNPVTG